MAVSFESTGLVVPDASQDRTTVYDEGSRVFLVINPISLYVFSLTSPADPQEIRVADDPKIQDVRIFTKASLLIIQRTPYHLQFLHPKSGKSFVQGSGHPNEEILGFAWTGFIENGVAIVTQKGVGIFSVQMQSQSLKSMFQGKHATSWWKYSPECGLLLLGSHKSSWIQGFQVSARGVARLSPFQLALPTMNVDPLPVATQGWRPTCSPDCLSILQLYFKVYCAVKSETELALYRVFKDGISLERKIDLPSKDLHLMVHDNLLILISSDLQHTSITDLSDDMPFIYSNTQAASTLPVSQVAGTGREVAHHAFYPPNLVHNLQTQEVAECKVDVDLVLKHLSPLHKQLAFVLRRSDALHPNSSLPDLALSLLKVAVSQDTDPLELQALFDILHQSQQTSGRGMSILLEKLSPQRVCKEVFVATRNMLKQDRYKFFTAMMLFRASAAKLGISLPVMLHILYMETAMAFGRMYQVVLELSMVQDLDFSPLAAQIAATNQSSGARSLADDMLMRLEDIESLCQSLIQQRKIIPALRLARKHAVLDKVLNQHILDLAEEQGPTTFLAAHRVYMDYHKA